MVYCGERAIQNGLFTRKLPRVTHSFTLLTRCNCAFNGEPLSLQPRELTHREAVFHTPNYFSEHLAERIY